MLKNRENVLVGRGDGQVEAGAAELQLGAALEEVPSQPGAESNGAFKACIAELRGSGDFASGRQMRIEHEKHAEIFFVRKFADHQIAETRGRFPVDVTRAVVR